MKNILVALMLLLLVSCSGSSKYLVQQSFDDQFSDRAGPNLVTLSENYIVFKEVLAGIPFSQLVPYVFLDSKNCITEMGFRLINVNQENWLNIRPGYELVFLVEGKRIPVEAENTKLDHFSSGYNKYAQKVMVYYFDYAWYKMSRDQMAKVCNSKNVKIQVNGKEGDSEYGVGCSLLDSFYANNKKFFDEEIATR